MDIHFTLYMLWNSKAQELEMVRDDPPIVTLQDKEMAETTESMNSKSYDEDMIQDDPPPRKVS